MTEDHRISSYSERLRLNKMGVPLRDGETRLYGKLTVTFYDMFHIIVQIITLPCFSYSGLNLARMLGDKFLKQQEPRFSSEPYISEAIHIKQASGAFALLAR